MVVSLKEAAFKLFDEGKKAISPEVKKLGLKSNTRLNYYWEWRQKRGLPPASEKEGVGDIMEPKLGNKQTENETLEPEDNNTKEPNDDNVEEPEGSEANPEKAKKDSEAISAVNEATKPKDKDEKKEEKELKIATTIADEGIRCTVFLSLQTLALYKIAASTQAQVDGGELLLLGDFLDTCAEDFFAGRGKKLGLISTGGR